MNPRSRVLVAALACATALLSTAAPAVARNDGHAGRRSAKVGATSVSTHDEMLGVVTAKRGRLVERDGAFRLVLDGVAKRQLWFTDRPARLAGTDSIEKLHRELFAGQKPPNAALEIATADKEHDVILLELSNPRYDAARHRATYDAKGLDATSRSVALSRFTSRADTAKGMTFGAATLFVDDAPLETACPASFGGQAGYAVTLTNIDCTTAQQVLNECNIDNCNVETATNLPQGTWYGQFQYTQAWFETPGRTSYIFWLDECEVTEATDCDY